MIFDLLTFCLRRLHNITELASLLIAIRYFKYIKDSFMKWVLPFLIIVFTGEILAYLALYQYNKPTTNIYYIIGLSEMIFYSYILYQFCGKKTFKKVAILFGSIGTLVCSIGYIFYRYDHRFFISGLIVSGFCLTILSLLYIYVKFKEDTTIALTNDSGFWICAGVSFFFSGSCIVFCLNDFISDHNLLLFGIQLSSFVPRVLCGVLYSCISIAIVQWKKNGMRIKVETRMASSRVCQIKSLISGLFFIS